MPDGNEVVVRVMQYLKDPDKRRATHNVKYPLEALVLETRDDIKKKIAKDSADDSRATVRDKKITLSAKNKTIEGVYFENCNFHDQEGRALALITHVTFRDCLFQNCWMGTIKFAGARFLSCRFVNCDFGFSHFEHCVFDSCSFEGGSADIVYFDQTELDAATFVKGLPFLERNYGASPEIELRLAHRELLEARRRIAGAILVSNSSINSRYIDASLLELRLREFDLQLDQWRFGIARRDSIKELPMLSREPGLALSLVWKKMNIVFTRAGTSLAPLILLMLAAVAVASVLIILCGLEFYKRNFLNLYEAQGLTLNLAAETSFASLSLLLGFGFNAFESKSPAQTIFLVSAAAFGMIWYALLIQVLLRRVYK